MNVRLTVQYIKEILHGQQEREMDVVSSTGYYRILLLSWVCSSNGPSMFRLTDLYFLSFRLLPFQLFQVVGVSYNTAAVARHHMHPW